LFSVSQPERVDSDISYLILRDSATQSAKTLGIWLEANDLSGRPDQTSRDESKPSTVSADINYSVPLCNQAPHQELCRKIMPSSKKVVQAIRWFGEIEIHRVTVPLFPHRLHGCGGPKQISPRTG
jgi:hypothetical protein